MSKKTLTEYRIACPCGGTAVVYKLRGERFMAHCAGCGRLDFFSNPVLLERLKHGGRLCPHNLECKPCRGGYTMWCPACRVRTFVYERASETETDSAPSQS
jgi:hypothetical protein